MEYDIEEIVKLLESDDIRRNQYITKFINIISNNGKNQITTLDGAWGSGKTIFVKKIELIINYCAFYENGKRKENQNKINSTDFSEEVIKKMEMLFKLIHFKEIRDYITESNINAIYFNAWAHDDEEDPIISIIYELVDKFCLIDSTKIEIEKDVETKIIDLIKLISMGKIELEPLNEKIDIARNIRIKERIKEAYSEVFDSIINENCNKLVIFIDELDRCKPEYAISLLEKIKHYIDDERVSVVLSTNIMELTHIIKAKYGYDFSSERYLDKFIDEHLYLPIISGGEYLMTFSNNLTNDKSTWVSIVMHSFIKYNKMQLREINKYISNMRYFERYINKTSSFMDKQYQIVKLLFTPYIVGLFSYSPIQYSNFIAGNELENLKSFIKSNEDIVSMCKYIFYNNDKSISEKVLLEDIEKFYNLMFKGDEDEQITINSSHIHKSNLKDIHNNISLLGNIAEFKKDTN